MKPRRSEGGARTAPRRRRTVLLVVGIVAALFPRAEVDAANAPITRCSMQVVTLDSTQGSQYATATLVHENKIFYIVTAYHVIYMKSDVTINFGGDEKVSVANPYYFDPQYYYNTVLDLAIFRLTEKGVVALGLRTPSLDNEIGTIRAIEIYPGATSSVLDRVAKGASASAVGNPQIDVEKVTYVPKNIVYSCTISDFERAKDRLKSFVRSKENNDRDSALENELMFLETFSITRGFSGGPVIVSTNHFEDGQLAGIVVGGAPLLFSGRFSWACDAKKIRGVFQSWASNRIPRGGATKSSGLLSMPFPSLPTDWAESPYELKNTYSFDDQRKYENHPFKGAEDGKDIFLNAEGYELVFDSCAFVMTNFSGAYLSGARFQDCTFEDVNFDDSILTGATFANCQFIGRKTFTPLLAAGVDENGDGVASGSVSVKSMATTVSAPARPSAGAAAPAPAPAAVYVPDPVDPADSSAPVFESILKQKAMPAPTLPPAPPAPAPY